MAESFGCFEQGDGPLDLAHQGAPYPPCLGLKTVEAGERQGNGGVLSARYVDHVGDVAVGQTNAIHARPFGIWLGSEQTAGDEAQLAILPFQIPPAVNAAQTPIAHCFSSCFSLARMTCDSSNSAEICSIMLASMF